MGNANSCTGGGDKVPSDTTHSIYVKTGDKKGAGTDGNIFISMADENGVWSEEQYVDTKWKDDFEKGNTDVFHLKLLSLGRIAEICIRRDSTVAYSAWYLENVIIELVNSQLRSVFPVHRWIYADTTLSLVEFDSTLPQFEKHPERRATELEKKRELYILKRYVPGAPYQIEDMPDDEHFSNEYQWEIVSTKYKLFARTTYIGLMTPDFKSITDFKKIYRQKSLPLPRGASNWRSDEEFGHQRLAGCNPVLLMLCQTIPEHFAVTAKMVEPFLEGGTLEMCMEQKKIYIVDLTYLADIKCAAGRKLCGPTGLFYSKKNGDLVPIAIQLMPQPAEDNPVFLPSDPEYTWLAAKLWFNLGDASHHQSVTHLGFTHLVMEAVVICTHRQLSPSHPIFKLLAPHFMYLLAINTRAVNKLVSENGWVDTTMHIGREGMFNIIGKNFAEWNIKEHGNLLADLKKRGVDDVNALPNYHYRDDAVLLWNALHKYVSAVVNEVYDTPEKLSGDSEIHGWAKELSEADIKGISESFSSNEDIIDAVTSFVFIGSAGHAAANFGQYNEYAFPPNYPAMLMGDRPTSKAPLTEDYIVGCIPSKKITFKVMIVTKILSRRGTNELTNFEVQYAFDPTTTNALETLKADLKQISKTVDERNEKRVRKYPYLHPMAVPNAISI